MKLFRRGGLRNEWTDQQAGERGLARLTSELRGRFGDGRRQLGELLGASSGGVSGAVVTLAQEASEFSASLAGRVVVAAVCLSLAWLLL